MKKRNQSAYGIFLILWVLFFIMGCVSDPVKVDLMANHPANPHAPETVFIAPLNPFENTASMAQHETDIRSSMTPEEHPPAHQHQMSPKMDKMGHGSKPSDASKAQDPENQHKEHNQ